VLALGAALQAAVAAMLGVAAEVVVELFLVVGSQEAGSQAVVFREAGSQVVASSVADFLDKAHGEGLAGRTSTAFWDPAPPATRDLADTVILGAPGVASKYPACSRRVRRISSTIVRCGSE
jgi:hypothetical protein